MISEPRQTCLLCSGVAVVVQTGRGFPPDVAKRRLQRLCRLRGCPCDPQYTAGFDPTALKKQS